jgi:hypothetical protein
MMLFAPPGRGAPLAAALAAALGLALLAPAPARSQQMPPGGMPSKAEIEKRIQEELDKLPDESSELEGVKLTYKGVPSNPADVVRSAGGQLPPGTNPDAAAKQFGPMARPYIEKYLGKVGKLKVDREFKQKSAKIGPGEYVLGLVMDDLTPVAVTISGGSLKAPVQAPIKPGAAPASPYDKLKIDVKAGKSADEFVFSVGFAKLEGQTPKFAFQKK